MKEERGRKSKRWRKGKERDGKEEMKSHLHSSTENSHEEKATRKQEMFTEKSFKHSLYVNMARQNQHRTLTSRLVAWGQGAARVPRAPSLGL